MRSRAYLIIITVQFISAALFANERVYEFEREIKVRDLYRLNKTVKGIKGTWSGNGRVRVDMYANDVLQTAGESVAFFYGMEYYGDGDSGEFHAQRYRLYVEELWDRCTWWQKAAALLNGDVCEDRFIKNRYHFSDDYENYLMDILGRGSSFKGQTLSVLIKVRVKDVELSDIEDIALPGGYHVHLAPSLDQQRALDKFNNRGDYPNYSLVAAHRGYWAEAGVSENTVEACRRALVLGADMLEVDIRTSMDGVPMLLHDPCIVDPNTGQKDDNIKTRTASYLMGQPTYDRFGAVTQYNINSLEQLLDQLGNKALISLDIKDTQTDWDNAFKQCLELVVQKDLLKTVIFKGSADHYKITQLMHQVSDTLSFANVNYTPVLYGDGFWSQCYGGSSTGGGSGSGSSGGGSGGPGSGDGSSSGGSGSSGGQYGYEGTNCFHSFKVQWHNDIKAGRIKAVETHFKVNSDPLVESGLLQWLQDQGVRLGVFIFTADQPNGVLNTNNSCETTVREYYHNPNYQAHQKPNFFNDGRGSLDWVFNTAKPTYVIHDRPDLLLDYLNAANMRDESEQVIKRVAFPDYLTVFPVPSGSGSYPDPNTVTETENLTDFEGIALHIPDVSKVEFFVPDTRNHPVKTDPIKVGMTKLPELTSSPSSNITYLPAGVTKDSVSYKFYNGYNYTTAEGLTCQQLYDTSTLVDLKNAPMQAKFVFPHRTIAEWSEIYPGYDIYLNSNYWATNGWTGSQSARERPEFWLPCTDIYGLSISNGVEVSYVYESYDPSGRSSGACIKDANGECIPDSYYDGRFDAMMFLENGEIEIVSPHTITHGNYLDATTGVIRRHYDGVKVLQAVSGYQIATGGVEISYNNITQKFNNDQKVKMRTVVGLKYNHQGPTEMYIVTVQAVQSAHHGLQKGLGVHQAAKLLVNHYNCDDVILMDSGKSAAMLTSVGSLPNIKFPASPNITAGTVPQGIDQTHLEQFHGKKAEMPYRHLATFLAIKIKE
ncbi:glycerophosphodiester phosphodiesterase family protein [Marinoscillum furvescens]|uniref:Glycerophosphoryl diester phosphodiesterase family protein n=1 Tax=Marinoscillum furvescens DSM 4134 TaxID=1122208 RepID=A0A3D9L2F6_MARFU|nr:glycerophosphodiester phosphodiesterase family protein [Marinoscillum furvescens]RED96564.1 glycerophosphoryl diester phosphodiesterase family protein [Marinoscillum furvescens DSM 4134]